MGRQALWNWTKAAIGLRHVRNALQTLVVNHVKTFYDDLKCREPKRICQCNQKTVANTKPIRGNQCPTCPNIYQRLITETIVGKPMISNCKVEDWRTNEWEVAKAFIPGVGYKDIDSADGTDVSGMISICLNATFIQKELFQGDIDAFNKVRDIRNKVFHSSTMEISIEDFEAYIQTMLDMLDDRLAKSEDDIRKGFQTAKEALGKLLREPLCEHCLEQIDCNKDALIALNVDATQLIDKLEQPQPDADTLQTQEKLAAIFNTQNVHSTRIACLEQKMDKTMHTLSSIPIHQKETVKIREKTKDSLAKQGIAIQPTLCEALKHDVKIFQPKQLFQSAPAKQDDRDKDELVLEILKDIQQAQNEMKLEMLTLKETVNDIQNKNQEATDDDLKIHQDDNDPNYGSNSKTDIQSSDTSYDPINDTAFPKPESHETDTDKASPDKDFDNNSHEAVSDLPVNDVDIARTENDSENNPIGTDADSNGEDSDQAEIHPGDGDINVLAGSMAGIMSNEQASALALPMTNAGNEDTTGAKSPDSPVLKFSKGFDIKLGINDPIIGITQLTPTTVVTSSFSAKILSLVDLSTRKVTSTLKLLEAAWDVTTVSYNQVAVTVPSIQTVQFVSVEETSPGTFTMRKTNEINMAGECLGIDYRNDQLAVTCIKDFSLGQGHVLVMKMSGEVEYDISSIDSIKIKVDSVKFAPSGQELFVTCEDDAVRKISLTGDVLACYRDGNLRDPRRLVMTTAGELLVCGYHNKTIHVVGKDEVMRTVLTKEDGIESLLSLCLCEDMNKLCVGMTVGKVAVFEMFCEK